MRRKSCIIILTTFALSVIALLWINRDQVLSGPMLPELAQNLPANFEEGDALFKKRIEERFPVGLPEQSVTDELARQGFDISRTNRMGSFEQPELVCRLVWRVFWETDHAGTIRAISGLYGGICL